MTLEILHCIGYTRFYCISLKKPRSAVVTVFLLPSCGQHGETLKDQQNTRSCDKTGINK